MEEDFISLPSVPSVPPEPGVPCVPSVPEPRRQKRPRAAEVEPGKEAVKPGKKEKPRPEKEAHRRRKVQKKSDPDSEPLQDSLQEEAVKRAKHQKKLCVLGQRNSSVRLLEELVFGDEEPLLEALGQEAEDPEAALRLDQSSDEEGPRSCDDDGQRQQPIKRAAWVDEDDEVQEEVEVRRRADVGAESTLSKTELKQRLKDRFQKAMGGAPAWALSNQSRAARDQDSDSDPDLDLTMKTGTFTQRPEQLPKGILKMKRCSDVNVSRPAAAALSSVCFHPSAQVAMTTGLDQSLSLFQVDGEQNPLVQNLVLDQFPVCRARFTPDGRTVMVTSFRNKLFYLYDLQEGKVSPVPGLRGLNESRVKEFSMSPVGGAVLLWGSRGYLHLLNLKTMEVVRSLKLNGEVGAVSFSSDGNSVFSSSDDGEVYVWDVRSSKCLNRFQDDGCVTSTAMSSSPNGRLLATGSSSGVVNIYSLDSCLSCPRPQPLKSLMNLVTSCTSLCFSPCSSVLSLGSRDADEALRLLHVPSLSVFSNFPLSKKKVVHRVQDVSFSRNSGFYCVANERGHAPLYRLLHYKDF